MGTWATSTSTSQYIDGHFATFCLLSVWTRKRENSLIFKQVGRKIKFEPILKRYFRLSAKFKKNKYFDKKKQKKTRKDYRTKHKLGAYEAKNIYLALEWLQKRWGIEKTEAIKMCSQFKYIVHTSNSMIYGALCKWISSSTERNMLEQIKYFGILLDHQHIFKMKREKIENISRYQKCKD